MKTKCSDCNTITYSELAGDACPACQTGLLRSTNTEDFSLIADCDCGCNGDWTDHTMRQGEKGIY